MPGISGVEISKLIDPNIAVVFITAHHDFAIEAFKIGTVDYILKPIDEERFQITLSRLRQSLMTQKRDKIPVKVGSETIFLNIDDIILIEKQKGLKKVAFYTNEKIYKSNLSLNILESKLSALGFIRTHKSFLVNIRRVEKVLPWGHSSYLIKLEGTKKDVIISRKYAPTVKLLLNII